MAWVYVWLCCEIKMVGHAGMDGSGCGGWLFFSSRMLLQVVQLLVNIYLICLNRIICGSFGEMHRQANNLKAII